MSNIVWDVENGWHDGPEATVTVDDRGRIHTEISEQLTLF